MKLLVASLLVASSLSAVADDYSKVDSLEVIQKQYQSMHYLERDYEIGKSTLTLSVGCQDGAEGAKQAIADATESLRQKIETAAGRLGLGEAGEAWGYDLEKKTSTSQSNPVTQAFNAERKRYVWKNTCTGEESDTPVRIRNVHNAHKTISLWFSNEGTLLNDLSSLVTELEELSSKAPEGVKVVCNSAGGTNYDLDVKDETKEEAWAAVEEVAKERAHEAQRSDFQATQYNNAWYEREYFTKGAATQLPSPSVVKENGEWVAKFKSVKQFTIFYKQSSETETDPAQLSGTKTYSVDAKVESKEGLYGTLTVSVSQSCQGTRAVAEQNVGDIGADILEKLREINDSQSTETDRLEVKDASAYEVNPLRSYQQYSGDRVVNYFYNPCTLEVHEVTKRPDVKVWQGTQSLTIRSSDLNALEALEKELKETYANELSDPNEVSVSASFSATAKLSVMEKLRNQLEAQAVRSFQSPDSEYSCEVGKYSYTCLAKPEQTVRPIHRGSFERAAAPEAAAYTEKSTGDVSESERGKKVFRGTYTVEYSVRKVLKDHTR